MIECSIRVGAGKFMRVRKIFAQISPNCPKQFWATFLRFSCDFGRHFFKSKHVGRIGVARGGQRGHGPPKILDNIVILCFEMRFSKQNSVIRLKSNIMAPQIFWLPPNFRAGYATGWAPFLSNQSKLGPIFARIFMEFD